MAMRNAIRVAAAAMKKKGDVPCCAPQSTLQRQSGGLIWAGDPVVVLGMISPWVAFFAGILRILRALGIDVVSLVSLCSWAGFSYSSYNYAVAVAIAIVLGLSFKLDASIRVAMLEL